MKPLHCASAKVSTGPSTSFESRTSTAAGPFATSTQCPAAPLRVLLRQVRVASCMVVPFQELSASILSSGRGRAAERFLPFSDGRSAVFFRQRTLPQVSEGFPVHRDLARFHPEETAHQPFDVHHGPAGAGRE